MYTPSSFTVFIGAVHQFCARKDGRKEGRNEGTKEGRKRCESSGAFLFIGHILRLADLKIYDNVKNILKLKKIIQHEERVSNDR